MQKDFFIYLTYKDKINKKFKVNDPKIPLGKLMENVVNSNTFDLPAQDASGAVISYFFGRIDENGTERILQPIVNDEDKRLHDYQIEPGTELVIVSIPQAG